MDRSESEPCRVGYPSRVGLIAGWYQSINSPSLPPWARMRPGQRGSLGTRTSMRTGMGSAATASPSRSAQAPGAHQHRRDWRRMPGLDGRGRCLERAGGRRRWPGSLRGMQVAYLPFLNGRILPVVGAGQITRTPPACVVLNESSVTRGGPLIAQASPRLRMAHARSWTPLMWSLISGSSGGASRTFGEPCCSSALHVRLTAQPVGARSSGHRLHAIGQPRRQPDFDPSPVAWDLHNRGLNALHDPMDALPAGFEAGRRFTGAQAAHQDGTGDVQRGPGEPPQPSPRSIELGGGQLGTIHSGTRWVRRRRSRRLFPREITLLDNR